MTWKGTIRSINAASRRMDRQAMQRRRELENQHKHYEKMQELEQAAYEVQVYDNYLERLVSLHKDCGVVYDWHWIANQNPPVTPVRGHDSEKIARAKANGYQPGFFDKLFKSEIRKRQELQMAVDRAIGDDDRKYQSEMLQYQKTLQEHQEEIAIAQHVLAGNLEHYKKAVENVDPFSEISEVGSSIDCAFHSAHKIKATVNIHRDTVIPRQSKALLKSGKLSIKDIPQARYNELYQDYVCSSVLRIGRELFALLPVEEVLVTAKGEILNQATGRLDSDALLSVLLVRSTMGQINFELIDPSDCMRNFKHNMGFKKSQGMSAVDELE